MTDETDKTAAAPAADTVVDEPKKIEADEPDTKADDAGTDDAGDKAKDEEGDQPDKRKKPTGSERAKRRADFLLEENRELQRRLEAAERQSPKGDGGEAKDEPPKEEDYNGDWTAYVAARSAYEAGKAVDKRLEARERSELDRRQADVNREREIAHLDRIDEARETIADFDKVMEGMRGVTIRDDVAAEIKASDKSPLLAYHLAKNPDKLRELNSMSGRELAREIGRLEGSIRMPAGKKQTTAPPPPGNLKGGAAPHTDLAQVDDMNEFADRLLKDLAKRAGR
jgi:hypothetical protein